MGACIKLIKCVIAAPIILLSIFLSILFWILWIVLLPIKCCCPGGCIVGLIAWVFEKGVKLPVNLAKCILK